MAEKEYIEREALLLEIDKNKPSNFTDSDAEIQEEIDYAIYRGLISTAPIADVVEVVRCKDCEWYRPYDKPVEDFDGKCTAHEFETDEMEYCSYGKRKDGADNDLQTTSPD